VRCQARIYSPYHIPQGLILFTQRDSVQEAVTEETGAARDDEENQITENVRSTDEEDGQPGSVKVGVWPPVQ
jgi:hypothetical protein